MDLHAFESTVMFHLITKPKYCRSESKHSSYIQTYEDHRLVSELRKYLFTYVYLTSLLIYHRCFQPSNAPV